MAPRRRRACRDEHPVPFSSSRWEPHSRRRISAPGAPHAIYKCRAARPDVPIRRGSIRLAGLTYCEISAPCIGALAADVVILRRSAPISSTRCLEHGRERRLPLENPVARRSLLRSAGMRGRHHPDHAFTNCDYEQGSIAGHSRSEQVTRHDATGWQLRVKKAKSSQRQTLSALPRSPT